MQNKYKNYLTLCGILMVFSSIVFFSCDKNKGDKGVTKFKFTIDPKSKTVKAGKPIKIKVDITGPNKDKADLTWSSENLPLNDFKRKQKQEIDFNGVKVVAEKKGNTYEITANKKFQCKVGAKPVNNQTENGKKLYEGELELTILKWE